MRRKKLNGNKAKHDIVNVEWPKRALFWVKIGATTYKESRVYWRGQAGVYAEEGETISPPTTPSWASVGIHPRVGRSGPGGSASTRTTLSGHLIARTDTARRASPPGVTCGAAGCPRPPCFFSAGI